nr:protein SCAR2-like [Tanacetum cinerariifolium]
MHWSMEKLQNTSMSTTMLDGGLHGFSNFPLPFPPIKTPPLLDQNENITYEKFDNGYEDMESSSNELPTGQVPSSSLSLVDDERPNIIQPLKIQRHLTPLIDVVAAHDKSKTCFASYKEYLCYLVINLECVNFLPNALWCTFNDAAHGKASAVVDVGLLNKLIMRLQS